MIPAVRVVNVAAMRVNRSSVRHDGSVLSVPGEPEQHLCLQRRRAQGKNGGGMTSRQICRKVAIENSNTYRGGIHTSCLMKYLTILLVLLLAVSLAASGCTKYDRRPCTDTRDGHTNADADA